jgi:hypothetical protein
MSFKVDMTGILLASPLRSCSPGQAVGAWVRWGRRNRWAEKREGQHAHDFVDEDLGDEGRITWWFVMGMINFL